MHCILLVCRPDRVILVALHLSLQFGGRHRTPPLLCELRGDAYHCTGDGPAQQFGHSLPRVVPIVVKAAFLRSQYVAGSVQLKYVVHI